VRDSKVKHNDGPCGMWTDAEKRYIHRLLFNRTDPTPADLGRAVQQMHVAFPEAHKYSAQSRLNYFRGGHFKKDQDQLLEEVQEQAPKRGFSVREKRVDALNLMAEKMHSAISAVPDEELLEHAAKVQKYLQEFRNYLHEIREEISRIGGTANEGIESLAQKLANDEKRVANVN